LVAALIILVLAFDVLSILSLEPRLPLPHDGAFTILAVHGDVNADGRMDTFHVRSSYSGSGEQPVLFQTLQLYTYNFTIRSLALDRIDWRKLEGANDTMYRNGDVVEHFLQVPASHALDGAMMLTVSFDPDPRRGFSSVNATFRLPPSLEHGATIDITQARLKDIVVLEQDNFSTNTDETRNTTSMMQAEGLAVPVMLMILIALLVHAVRRDRPWLRSLGRSWWVSMVLILIAALFLRVWYGDLFQRTQIVNNMRNVRFAQHLLGGSTIFWSFGSGHPYILSIVYAASGTGVSAWGAEGTAMAVSLAVSLVHVLALGLLGAAFLSPRAGLAAAALLTTLPLDLLYATTVRRDGLASLFMTVSLFLMVRGSRSSSRSHLYAGAAAMGMALFTVRPLLVILVPWLAFLILACDLPPRRLKGPLVFLLLAAALPALALMFEAMTYIDGTPILGGMILTPEYLTANAGWMVFYLFGGDHHASLITLLAIVGVLSLRRRGPGKAASLAAFPIMMSLFFIVHRVPIAYCTSHRHLIFLYPTLLLMSSEGVAEVWKRWRERYGSEPLLILALAALYIIGVHAGYLDGVLALRRCI
jgi:hypothetical protein